MNAVGPGAHETAHETAQAFIHAIVWGEHLKIWDLLSIDAREYVLAAASRKGMDAVAIERGRQGTWNGDEADIFLRSLVHGLRVDLSGVDLDQLVVTSEPRILENGDLRFELECLSTLPDALTGGANWAAGAVIVCSLPVADLAGPPQVEWRVQRLVPRPATRPAS